MINREVMIEYLRRFDGIFLEIGPDASPLLENYKRRSKSASLKRRLKSVTPKLHSSVIIDM